MRKEGELCRKPFEKELRDLDLLLQNSFLSRRDSLANSSVVEANEMEAEEQTLTPEKEGEYLTGFHRGRPTPGYVPTILGHESPMVLSTELRQLDTGLPRSNHSEEPTAIVAETKLVVSTRRSPAQHSPPPHQPTPENSNSTPLTNGIGHGGPTSAVNEEHHDVSPVNEARPQVEPLTPALSCEGDVHPFANGGIPWYMVPFDPVGTTIEEERWTGRDLVRGMSEELSDMDEDELSGLVDLGMPGGPDEAADGALLPDAGTTTSTKRPKPPAKRKRWRGYR